MKNLFFPFICLLAFSYTTRAQNDNYSFKEAFEVTAPAQLVISSEDGNIEVLPSDQNRIEVYYIVKRSNTFLKISRAEIEKEVILKAISSVNSLKINVQYPKDLRLQGPNNHLTVSLKVYVPKQTTCDLKTSDGNISISGLIGDQVIKTGDGNVHVSNIKGSIKGNTSDGNIQIRVIRGAVSFKTSDGNVSLEDIIGNAHSSTGDGDMKASKIQGDLSLASSDGDIDFDTTEGSVTAITSDGNINGNVVELRKKLSLKTGDGNIKITIPDRLGLNLNIRGSVVHTPLKNFSGTSAKNSIQGKLNGGGIPVELRAGDGNVNLSYR